MNHLRKTSLLAVILFCLTACDYEGGNNSNDNDQAAVKNKEQLKDHSASADKETDWLAVPLPDITRQPIKLRVASVVNPRFKQLSAGQIQQILMRSQALVKQHFNLDIEFFEVDTLSIEDAFDYLGPAVRSERRSEIVDINFIDEVTAKQAREDMQQSLFKTLSEYAGNKQSVIDYAQPYLLDPEIKQKDFIGLSYALVDTLIARLKYWKTEKADDGEPVLDSNGYHEWVWWDSLGYSEMPYDILITNQLVASAEYYAMDVHSSIRGGLTAGTTTYAKNTLLNAYAYIMVYPMLNDTALLTKLRDDESYSNDQIINYSAALLTHELGHLLLHLGHPFGNKSCIMSPTVMLNYRDWYDNFNAEQCAVGSNKEMAAGAVNLEYNRSW